MDITAVSLDNANYRASGESSPSPSPSPLSAESSFRELDDAFLQKQTRIWLGEVLQIRFDEETNISDILADGELLFEAAEVLSRVLPAPHIRANESKTLVSSKSTRRYMPYYNVATFLRMCKNLGLNGIDLFSPSDVVEKRDTRKVCMCIRSLSKKVRSREINVPDFDSVVCTLSMPTDMVKGIRKSLEQSQCTSSLSTGHESGKLPRVRYWKRMSNSDSMVSNGNSSDNCDEAESRHIVVESNQLSDYPGSELIKDDSSLPDLHLNTCELENGEHTQYEYLSPSVPESVGSPSSVYFSDQELNTVPSSTFQASHISGMYRKMQNDGENGDINHVPLGWGDIFLSHDEDNSDTASCDSCPVTRENKTYYAGIENLSCPSDIECELSDCDSLERTHWNNLVSNGERDLDACDECFEVMASCPVNENVDGVDIEHKIHPCELIKITHHLSGQEHNLDSSSSDSNYAPRVSIEATNASNEAFDVKSLTSDPKEECTDNYFMGLDARHPLDLPETNLHSSNTIASKDNTKWSDESSQNPLEVFDDHNIEDENMDGKPGNLEDIPSVNSLSSTTLSPEAEAGRVENVQGTGHNMEKDVSEDKGIDHEMRQSKPHMTLIKSVAKGTAVVGVAVFLLHLRWKNNKGDIPKLKKKPIQVPKKSTTKFPSQKTENVRNSSSVYPSQKLHLGI